MLGKGIVSNWYAYVKKNGLCVKTIRLKLKFEQVVFFLEKRKIPYYMLENTVVFAFMRNGIVRMYEVSKKKGGYIEISVYEFKL
jgi:hypothetical protein